MFNNIFKKFKKIKNDKELGSFQVGSSDAESVQIIELLEKIYAKQNKQSIVTDDIFETIEDKINNTEKLEEELKEYKQCEKKLLELSMTSVDSLNVIEKYANRTESISQEWISQINLVNREINVQMSKCGIEKISNINEKVDTLLHQVVEIAEVNDASENSTVKEVLVNGYIYKGKVLKKAKIIANVYKEKTL